jgi:hypothetical protein
MNALHACRAITLLVASGALAIGPAAAGQGPGAPRSLQADDHPFDLGDRIAVSFEVSPDDRRLTKEERDSGARGPVAYYEVQRSPELNGVFATVERREVTDKEHRRGGRIEVLTEKNHLGEDYWFRVRAVAPDGAASAWAGPVGPVFATREFIDGGRFALAIITAILCGAVIYWIRHARSGKPLKVRKIAGLEAVDEAVGRATEMGRPCLFIAGTQDMNDIQTIAGITVLARVARTAAEYDAKVEVPTSRSLVMTAARETVEAAYLAAGRPDAFNEDLIYYVTDEQFGYVAYLQGMMVRQKPAACFYMGAFFAESLILAETGNSIGAIQVAGTAQPAQLPFFVAACDYTLIGEEFFAASAYLSGSAEELGSLKGQDVGKLLVAAGLFIGVALITAANLLGPTDGLGAMFMDAVDYLRDVVLT